MEFCQAPEDGEHGRSEVLAMADRRTRLRPATPERDEGLVFARYLDQAADGFFEQRGRVHCGVSMIPCGPWR